MNDAFFFEASDALARGAARSIEELGEFTEGWSVSVGMGEISDGCDGHYLIQGEVSRSLRHVGNLPQSSPSRTDRRSNSRRTS